ncbi:MAG: TetR/AcrR family transcriptional regulator [Myxococcales bacterium]|nr:TetR/AcrR family transcriptional regulator [Polyangiaceae bacterium]MDW8248734.1 TetR/AcrR family transcriptional regulator [Myxococcales bacterium]
MARPQDPRAKIELLKAAEAVFVEHGLERARVEEITTRAGRSKGSFYLHFSSKEEAFRQIVETLVARLGSFVDEPPPPGPVDLEVLLRRQLERSIETFEFLWMNRGVVGLLMSGGGSAEFGYLIVELEQQYRQMIERWLRWGMAQGIYRNDMDADLISLALAGAYDSLARRVVKETKRPDLRGMLLEMERFVAHAVGTPEYIAQFDSMVNNLERKRNS